jgi:aldehyde dehydrogenase (NAD+)
VSSIAEIYQSMDYGPAPEATAAAEAWLDDHGRSFSLFINNEWVTPAAGESFETFDPATGRSLARLVQASADDVDGAVAAARAAQPDWAALPGQDRARRLYALARLVQRHARLLAVLETLDNGKSIRETRDIDIPLVARHFYHHAGWASLMETEFPGQVPHGVVGQVIPWNFPLLMLAWKVAPALAAGNTVVLKPAEYTSLTALLFCELALRAGLPAGVFNVVTGDGRTGAALVEHPGVDKVAFTGSTAVGRQIRELTAGSGKALTLELGGKSPFIVFNDADLDSAVEGVVDAIWFNQGQVCCAGSRLLVQEDVAETLLAKLRRRMDTLRVGSPLDKSVDMGAIVHPTQRDRIAELVQQGVAEGAELWQAERPVPEQGCFYPPTLLTRVQPAHQVAQEEIFGPVLVAMSFRTPAEAVALANNSRYGLAASIWSDNINVALELAPQLKVGVVWINSTNQFDAACGFGGVRESGFGREGGREGMHAYVRPAPQSSAPVAAVSESPRAADAGPLPEQVGSVDRTRKMYIGGRQVRPDSGYSRAVHDPSGALVGEVGEGNRKDIRNAVEAARAACGWAARTAYSRSQIMYFVAENLDRRRAEFIDLLRRMTHATPDQATREVDAAVRRLFVYAGWADKYDGKVHSPPARNVTVALHEPLGVMGIACPDEHPLLSFVSLVAPAVAVGNCVVAIPSPPSPLSACDLCQVLDTSDLPGGVINVVTGERDPLVEVLAAHDDVDGCWYFGPKPGSALVEKRSVGNMKRTWVNYGEGRDWFDIRSGEGPQFLRQCLHVKNVWIPYGE